MKQICSWPGCLPDCRRDCEAHRAPPTESDYADDAPAGDDLPCRMCDGSGDDGRGDPCEACGGSGSAA